MLTLTAWANGVVRLALHLKPAALVASLARLMFLTALALIAFAGHSMLCRAALAHGAIDAAGLRSFA